MSQHRLHQAVSTCLSVLNRSRAVLCFALLICCSTASTLAQGTNAAINGQITDPQGRVLPGTEIQAVDIDTNVVYSTKANGSGIYALPQVPPGRYRLMVRKDGFKVVNKTDITLHVQDILEQNFALEVGSVSESVTVEGGGQVINTTDASVSTVVDQKFVANMPLNGRSFQDLISMTPGVVTQSPQSSALINATLGAAGDFSVNGQRTESNYYTVDGVTANVSGGAGSGFAGPSTGGTLGASTALGTTQSLIPVDALQEFRVESSTYSAEYGHSPGGQFALVTRSGSNALHGTVFDYLRNNFFDANDWFNDHYGDPQPALRQNDFGGTLGGPVRIPRLYNGKDRTFFFVSYEGLRLDQPTAAAVQYVPDLFMRQQAATALQPILNAFPLPNGIDYGTSANPSLAQFLESSSLPSSIDSTSIRVDHVISPKLSVFFRFGDTPSSTAARQDFALDTIISNAQTYTLGAIAQLSRGMTDEFRLGYARSNSSDIGVIDNFGGATPINLGTAIGVNPSLSSEPIIAIFIPGIATTELLPNYGKNSSQQWNLVDTFNLSLGRHTLKFGIDYRHIKSPLAPTDVLAEAFWESATELQDNTTAISAIQNRKGATPLTNETALFAQDEWRLHPRLTLSLGLRWEVDPPPTEQHGDDAYTLLGNIGDPASLSLAPQGTPLWKTDWYDFAPRLGVAWTPRNRPGTETVVRAGGGVFFDTANEVAAAGYSFLGFTATTFSSGLSLPYTTSELTVPISTTAPYTSGIPVAFPSHLQLPYTLEWNTSIQQALGKNQALTISYVGSNGRRLLAEQELSLTSLNPNFGTILYYPAGITSNYQALQAQFQRTVARGIQALASYTWSHSIDFGSSAESLALERGNSDFDVRNNLQGGISWDLPTVASARVGNILLNGWGLDARLNVRSAFPVNPQGNDFVDPATENISFGELNLVAGQPIYLHGNQYPGGKAINPAAFSLPAGGIQGDAPRDFVRGFGATQLNMAVRREFHLHNDLALQFRAEAFNVLNHPIFGYVDPLYTDLTFGQALQTLNSSLGTLASQYQQGGPRSMQFALKLHF
jgi:Carboxypeptidase regulatory-like domain/TonB dependent receptor/TonB-dependent Receptor Plug Domain